jgi:hypothetical protein
VTATPARFDSTMIVASSAPHPAIHPTHGLKALVAHVKDVPQSGATRLSSR